VNKIVDVTAYISTKDRYLTTLPLAIASIAMQTVTPKKFILFEDGEPTDIRTNRIYLGLLHILTEKGINWSVEFGKQMGQVWNHQKAIDTCTTDFLWRIDDDEYAEPNVLEGLLSCMKDDVGAVAGLVIDPTQIQTINDKNIKNDLIHIDDQPNVQWAKNTRTDVFEVEHLYSSFLYRKDSAPNGYCLSLSAVGHREETIFSHEIFRNGKKLLVNPNVKTWHLREPTGGIRSHNDKSLWDKDEAIFQKKLKEWETIKPKDESYYLILDNGLGDHFMVKNLLPEILEKHKNVTIAACYPAVFEGENVKLISIQEAKDKFNGNIDRWDIYRYCGERKWDKSLIEAFKEMYLR
jgi:hypothetical protein